MEEKLATLKNLDAEILDLLTEDTSVSEEAIAEEVEQADTVKELANGAIVTIDDVLESGPSATATPPSSTAHTVLLI